MIRGVQINDLSDAKAQHSSLCTQRVYISGKLTRWELFHKHTLMCLITKTTVILLINPENLSVHSLSFDLINNHSHDRPQTWISFQFNLVHCDKSSQCTMQLT